MARQSGRTLKEFAQEVEEKKKTTRANVYLQWHLDWLEWAKGAEAALIHIETTLQEDLLELEEEVTWSRLCATLALKAYRCLLDPALELPEEFPLPPPQYMLMDGAQITALWDSTMDPDNNDDFNDYYYYNNKVDDGFEDYDYGAVPNKL